LVKEPAWGSHPRRATSCSFRGSRLLAGERVDASKPE
jgi:hypothetical protein